MLTILQLLAVASLWAVVGAVVLLVDPIVIKDVLIPNSYLPMVMLVGIAGGYTAHQLVSGWKALAITLFVMVLVGLLLLL